MVAPEGKILVYLDWRTQEVGVAAALADDDALKRAYASGDVYHIFARDAGLTQDPDRKHWKRNNLVQRERMKSLQLGINYGMGVASLAKGLDRHPLVASNLIERHRRMYPRFWQWRDRQVEIAMQVRQIKTTYSWPLHISTSPNKRTLYNFPMQGNGAEMLRLAVWKLCEADLVPVMLVHDGILLELDNQEQIAHAIEIMRWAGRQVCNGFEIDVDVDQLLEPGERYCDKRELAQQMWATVMGVLETVRVVPREGVMSHFVVRHGRRIEVEEYKPDTGRPQKQKPNKGHHIGCPTSWLKRVLPITRSGEQLALALWLYRRHKISGNAVLETPNTELYSDTGLTRFAKYRGLRNFEKAGMIRRPRSGAKASSIELLWL
jgi:DNA polymerase family A